MGLFDEIERANKISRKQSAPVTGARRVGSVIANTLLGLRQAQPGITQAAQFGDPLTAALAGAAGAIGAPTIEDIQSMREAQQSQLQLQQLSAAKLGDFSPELSSSLQEKLGIDFSDVPIGLINKLSPILSQSGTVRDLEQKLALNQSLTDNEIKFVGRMLKMSDDEVSGLKKVRPRVLNDVLDYLAAQVRGSRSIGKPKRPGQIAIERARSDLSGGVGTGTRSDKLRRKFGLRK